MPLNSTHPSYAAHADQWVKLTDCYAGEAQVKQAEQRYLAATSGMQLDGLLPQQPGRKAYDAYKMRAVYPNFITRAVQSMVGVMHGKPPQIELPPSLEPLRERATIGGESLAMLLRRINEAQLTTGRIGLLADFPVNLSQIPQPYLCLYPAAAILNWDDEAVDQSDAQSLTLVVLDESGFIRQADFDWRQVQQHRVLWLRDGSYESGLFRETTDFNEAAMLAPLLRGQAAGKIPFVCINATDNLPAPQAPPLLELADLCLAIYRGEADYRQALFMQGQDTFVTIGDREPPDVRLGAGAHVHIVNESGDAKFVGVSGQGLPEQRQALENARRDAKELSGQILDATSRQKESGEALQIRVAAQTITLHQLAKAGAEGLQTVLRIVAEWQGVDPLTVVVSPNLDFAAEALTPGDYLSLLSAKEKGLPLSTESLHAALLRSKLTIKDFMAEMELLNAEQAAKLPAPIPTPNPTQPNKVL